MFSLQPIWKIRQDGLIPRRSHCGRQLVASARVSTHVPMGAIRFARKLNDSFVWRQYSLRLRVGN